MDIELGIDDVALKHLFEFALKKAGSIKIISVDSNDFGKEYTIEINGINSRITSIDQNDFVDKEDIFIIWWQELSPLESKYVTNSATFKKFEFLDKPKKEFIICAAIHCNNYEEYNNQPTGIATGFIVSGRRHSDCYTAIESILKCADSYKSIDYVQKLSGDRNSQGFITSANRYVSREVAFKIAKTNNQIYHGIHDNNDEGILISEDLY